MRISDWSSDVCSSDLTTGQELPSGATAFADIAASTHREAIEAAFHAGLVQGTAPTLYSPRPAVTRAQMASLVMRFAAALVLNGHGALPSTESGSPDIGR